MQKKSAFTLVELIVSVTIVSLLGAIGFQGFTSYLSSVRDTSRTSQLMEIYDTLTEKKISGTLPMPDNYIEIVSNGKVIGYQGYAGEKVLSSLGLPNTISDPKDDTYYSYYLTKNKKYSEVMAFLEEKRDGKESTFFETINPIYNTQINYQERYPIVYGNKLGILTTKSNQPIQEIKWIQEVGTLDILNTNEELVARLENNMWLSGSGANLYQLKKLAEKGGRNCIVNGVNIECLIK